MEGQERKDRVRESGGGEGEDFEHYGVPNLPLHQWRWCIAMAMVYCDDMPT